MLEAYLALRPHLRAQCDQSLGGHNTCLFFSVQFLHCCQYPIILFGSCSFDLDTLRISFLNKVTVNLIHTLKAMGSLLGFPSRKSWVTSLVKGP